MTDVPQICLVDRYDFGRSFGSNGGLRDNGPFAAAGRSYRLNSRELGLSRNTVLEIVKRNRAMSA
jgi:hypothetical protein